MPPIAAIIGNVACLKLESSPWINSLFISNVTKKKNIAINASLIQCKIDNLRPKLLKPTKIYFSKILKYNSDKEELLTINAIIALINKIKPLAASNLKNHLNGAEI